MSEPGPSRGQRGPQIALALALALPALLMIAWSRPIAAPPLEVPPLALAPDAVAAQRADDAEAAAAAPTSEAADAWWTVYRETNTAEVDADDYPPDAVDRRRRLLAALAAVEEAHGPEAPAQLRAAAVAEMDRALAGDLAPDATRAALGRFVDMLRRYGMAAGDRQIAPRFVVRTAFKARWNTMHSRATTEDLSEIELQAHWGWLALHATPAPLDLRLEAVDRYAEAGGPLAGEARGALLVEAGRLVEAAEAFEAAYDADPIFRLRNHALFAADSQEDP